MKYIRKDCPVQDCSSQPTLGIRSSHDLSWTIQHLLIDLQEIGIKLQCNSLQVPHSITPAGVVGFSLKLCQNRLSEDLKHHIKLAEQALAKSGKLPYSMFDAPLHVFQVYSKRFKHHQMKPSVFDQYRITNILPTLPEQIHKHAALELPP